MDLQPSFSKGLCIHPFLQLREWLDPGSIFLLDLICIHDAPLCAEQPYDVMTPLVVVVIVVIVVVVVFFFYFLRDTHIEMQRLFFLIVFILLPLLGIFDINEQVHLLCGLLGDFFFFFFFGF